MSDQLDPIAVKFPLSGEWCAVNTPGHKIPSHGTDQFGQRYAYDFLQIDWSTKKGFKYFPQPLIQGVLLGVKLEETFCWSQPIYSPFEGEVIEAKDGCKERNPVYELKELFIFIKNSFTFKAESNEDMQPILGNYIILKGKSAFALIAHARYGSIKVTSGEMVNEGQELAQVGHSGNSTAPHLHFQLMDSANLIKAKGIPCCFKEYECYQDGQWTKVYNSVPRRRERIHA